MNSPTKTLALLFDGDNVALKHIKPIIQFCEVIDGTLSIKNAYGDWIQPPLASHYQTITELGVTCVQQNRVGRNATDFGLAMDVALMLEKGEIDIYFIVSNDGDFTAVCEWIQQKGANVIGIGSKENASSAFRMSCDTFLDIEEIAKIYSEPAPKTSPAPKVKTTPTIKQPAKASPAPKPKPKTTPKPAPKASPAPKPKTKPAKAAPDTTESNIILKMLTEAYQKAPPQPDGWVLLSHLGGMLREVDDQFEQRFANKKLSKWLKDFPDQFEVSGHHVRMR